MHGKRKKKYSTYDNPNKAVNDAKPVKKGSVIVGNLSDYEKLPKQTLIFCDFRKRKRLVLLI